MAKITLEELSKRTVGVSELNENGYIELTRLRNNFVIVECSDTSRLAYYEIDEAHEEAFDIVDEDYFDEILGVFGYDIQTTAKFLGLPIDDKRFVDLVDAVVDLEPDPEEEPDDAEVTYGIRESRRRRNKKTR